MDCPQCKGYQLEPGEIEAGLIACRCPKCQGMLLPLMNYRYWVEQSPDVAINEADDVVVEDSSQPKLCPKCSRVMTRFRIGAESQNRLELCGGCDEAWLDAGEWQLLKSLDIHKKLHRLFTDAWQRKIRLEQQEAHLKNHYEKKLGAETFSKIDDFKQWLDGQQGKDAIIQYLTTRMQ